MAGEGHVLLTRPAGRNQRFAAALQQAGWRVSEIPCLEVQPLQQGQQPGAVAELDRFQLVIVISPAAAAGMAGLLDAYWPQPPLGVEWLAVGESSAAPLAAIDGLGPVRCPAGAAQQNSEGLLALERLQQVAGQRLLLCKGEGGRELLAETLRGRGAEVTELVLYRRAAAGGNAGALQQLLREDAPDLIVAWSGDSVDALLDLGAGLASMLRKVPLCVPGQRVAEHARAQGFQQLVVAPGAGVAQLVEAAAAWRDGRSDQVAASVPGT